MSTSSSTPRMSSAHGAEGPRQAGLARRRGAGLPGRSRLFGKIPERWDGSSLGAVVRSSTRPVSAGAANDGRDAMSTVNGEISRRFTELFSTGDEALAEAVLIPDVVFHGTARD